MKKQYKTIKGNERRMLREYDRPKLIHMLINMRSWGFRYDSYPRIKSLMMAIAKGQKSWSGDVRIDVLTSFRPNAYIQPDQRCGRGHSYKLNNPDWDMPF